jgi:hypothetical protein
MQPPQPPEPPLSASMGVEGVDSDSGTLEATGKREAKKSIGVCVIKR